MGTMEVTPAAISCDALTFSDILARTSPSAVAQSIAAAISVAAFSVSGGAAGDNQYSDKKRLSSLVVYTSSIDVFIDSPFW
ncbi:MAG: hypothetical protein HRT77_01355 [Halioglobus sp.]|nr:hypothetical protein [Halioglobus sp.]